MYISKEDFEAWMEGTTEHPGSWWTDWTQWLQGHGGKQVPAPKDYGNKAEDFIALEPAPGSYVKKKV